MSQFSGVGMEKIKVNFSYELVTKKDQKGERNVIKSSGFEAYDASKLYRLNAKVTPGTIYIPTGARLSEKNLYIWRKSKKIGGATYSTAILALLSDKKEMKDFITTTSSSRSSSFDSTRPVRFNIKSLPRLLFPKDLLISIDGRKYNVVARSQVSDISRNIDISIKVTSRTPDTVSKTVRNLITSQIKPPDAFIRGTRRIMNKFSGPKNTFIGERCAEKKADLAQAYTNLTSSE